VSSEIEFLERAGPRVIFELLSTKFLLQVFFFARKVKLADVRISFSIRFFLISPCPGFTRNAPLPYRAALLRADKLPFPHRRAGILFTVSLTCGWSGCRFSRWSGLLEGSPSGRAPAILSLFFPSHSVVICAVFTLPPPSLAWSDPVDFQRQASGEPASGQRLLQSFTY